MIETNRTDDVITLRMVDGENRINPTFLSSVNGALDHVEASDGPVVAVLTGEGKFFSNGLDLEWMGSAPEGAPLEVVNGLQALYARMLTLPFPLIAAVNGHAFAGGAMLALACDAIVMREDRGFFCVPEVDINIPFTDGMAALCQCRMASPVAHAAMLSGRRYTAAEAVDAGFVAAAVPEADVEATAADLGRPFAGKTPSTVRTIKERMYASVLTLLAEEIDFGI